MTTSLRRENRQLRERLEELEETLRVITSGQVDALVVPGPKGKRILTLTGALDTYRLLVEAMSDGAVTLAQSGTILYCNDYFAGMVGMRHDQVIGMSFVDLVAPRDRGRFAKIIAQSVKDDGRDELMLQAADGKPVPAYLSMHALPDSEGRAIAVVVTDLSEVAATAEARSLLALTVESSDDAIISTTLDGVVLSWNRAAEKLFGYSVAEAVGQPLAALIISPGDVDEVARKFDALRRGKRTEDLETVRLHKDGSPIDVSIVASPILDAEQGIIGASINIRDIAERKRAATELHKTTAALGERLKEIQCLYAVAILIENDALSLEQTVQRIVETIPPAMQYSEAACARISLKGKQYKSRQFKNTPWRLATSIVANGEAVGEVEAFYREEKRVIDEGPFLHEEEALIARIAGNITDYLQRIHTEEALQRSEKEFRELAESMPQIVWVTRPDGWNIYFNQQWMDYTGLTLEESHGDGWHKPFHPDEQQRAWDVWQDAMKNNSIYSIESRLRRADGTYRWWLMRGVPLHDDSGNILKWFGTCTDIHDLKTAELEITKANLELSESERRFSDMLENAELISYFLDREGQITFCNEYLLCLTGWQHEEVIGQNWFEMFVPDDIPYLENEFFPALLANQPETRHHENEILTRSGERRLIYWNNSVLRSAIGDVIGTASIGQDITEQKAAEARIKYLNRVRAVTSGINSLIGRVKDRDELFSEACRIAVEVGGFRSALLCIVDRQTEKVVSIASSGKDQELLTKIKHTLASKEDSSRTMIAGAIREKHAIVSNDSVNDPQPLFARKYAEYGVRSIAVLPVIVADQAVGTLALYSREIEFFHEEEMNLLTKLTDDIVFAIDYLDNQQKINYLAYYDTLTGLANRRLFIDRVAQSMRGAVSGGHKLALYLINLERFKNINDSFGRAVGDELLQQVAKWLANNTGDATLLARIEADHFAIVVPRIWREDDMVPLVEKMTRAFTEHLFRLNDSDFRIAVKAGIAVFPDDGDDADTLLLKAEAALSKAKNNGERYLFYTQEMTEAVAGKLAMENKLRQAIDNEEFVLHYQPKVNFDSGKIAGAEALLRWNDPLTGLVPPDKFIPILEETGMIYEVGRWALQQAIADNLSWRNAGLPALRIAVNVSALQLRRYDFIAEIERAISNDTQAAAGLELEITESLVMEDVEHNTSILQAVRAMGITIAIDDFGTGFSSLSYLAKLPVTTLKIDRTFVTEMTNGQEGLALVSTIINLAHAFKLNVVAEGVETEEQSRLLRLLDCDEMQGFLFSKAIPCEEFEQKLLASSVQK